MFKQTTKNLMIEQADRYFEYPDYDAALSSYQQFLQQKISSDLNDPNQKAQRARALYRIGFILSEQEEYQDAVAYFEKLIEHKDQLSASQWVYIAKVYSKLPVRNSGAILGCIDKVIEELNQPQFPSQNDKAAIVPLFSISNTDSYSFALSKMLVQTGTSPVTNLDNKNEYKFEVQSTQYKFNGYGSAVGPQSRYRSDYSVDLYRYTDTKEDLEAYHYEPDSDSYTKIEL